MAGISRAQDQAKNDAERLSTGAPGPSPETIEDFQQFLEGFS